MPPCLSSAGEAEIRIASREEVFMEFSRLATNFNTSGFLSSSNMLIDNTIGKIKTGNFTDDEMKQYIAASTITHLQDSWNFLGQAIQATLNGQTAIARHLAYYTELRAGMSLLATEGIGIFNNQHYYIDSTDFKPKKLSDSFGTHQMIWLTLQYWSSQDKARTLLEEIITPGGIPLKDWVNGYKVNTWNSITSEIFNKWGVDLASLSSDRDTRNRVSYRPSQLHTNQTIDFRKNYGFIVKLWELLEPSVGNNYLNIDNLFLKQSINLLDELSAPESQFTRNRRLYIMLKALLSNNSDIRTYYEFIRKSENNSVLSNASTIYTDIDLALQDPNNHLQVIARALFLVRLATGAVKRMMNDAGIDLNDMDFWFYDIIQISGICPQESIDELDFHELWDDISTIAIPKIKNSNQSGDLYAYKRQYSQSSILFSECERAMLWGLSS